ncbi:MAG TPA: hypothetical protein VII73_02955 [Caulobacteraceae bacterium]
MTAAPAVPVSTLDALFEEENRLLQLASEKYGKHFGHACDATALLSLFIKSANYDREIFLRYMSHAKKHHTLALMSTVRLHKIQAMLNLRFALESAANAAFSLCNPSLENFLVNGAGSPARKTEVILSKAYKWLAKTLPEYSGALKSVKDNINATSAHSNIVYTASTFRFDPDVSDTAETPFFDIEDPYFVSTDLWLISNAAVGIIGMIAAASEVGAGLELAEDFLVRFSDLMKANQGLQAEFMAGDRYKAAAALSVQGAK